MEAPVVNLNTLIEGQKVQKSTIVFLVVATLAMMADGFDLAVIGFVGPELVKDWKISPAQLSPVFSAGIFGLLVGAPLFGILGDRIGRKNAILIGLCTYGSLTLLTMLATSLNQFAVLRFLTGIGLGGMIPNVLALAAEVAPRRLRGLFSVIVLFGVPAGLALPGWTSALLVPQYGWPALLFVGGVLPLVIAVVACFTMNESLKFLVQHGGRDEEARILARALRPDLSIDPRSRFSYDSLGVVSGVGSPIQLFKGGLAVITPLLWIALAANQLTNFFVLSWLPTLLQSAGMSTAQAGISASAFSIGGLGGGVLLIFLIDRFGALPVVILFALGAPLVAMMGTPGLAPFILGAIIAGAGFCVTGNNFGINAALVMIYPTSIRSTGAGWAQAAGRLGSLAGPMVGGMLLAMHLPQKQLYYVPALSLGVGAMASGLLVALCFRRFRSFRLDEASAAESSGSIESIGKFAPAPERPST
ncbi:MULTISPECIES: MFS transporter [unclassified Bradyrhizobium]|uniref:MFS transporter n=1 Tax=unclassified Bradyrhizobium TaxID=2631580 RepID=UPI00143CDB3C|nr:MULTISPECIES: MFS transporter [unclassified Bradyrhizobium]